MSLIADLRFAGRTLRAKPVFTAIAVASLALGIGANTAIFSVVESALLRSLPYDHPERLLLLRDHQPLAPEASISPGEYLDYQKQTRTFSGLAAFAWQSLTLNGNGEPQRLRGASVTPNFFQVLGAHAQAGRLFQSEFDKPGEDRAAVLSDETWRGVFGSDPNIVGRVIHLNGNAFRVVGVLRQNEAYPADRQVWVTPRYPVPEYVEDKARSAKDVLETYGNHWLSGVGSMREGITEAEAQAEMHLIAGRIGEAHAGQRDHYAVTMPLHETMVHDIHSALWVLLGSVVLLLLIACSNLAGLLLARATGRTRELAVRVALGASKAQIIRLLLAESLLLAIAGGGLGVFLAAQAQHWISKYSTYDLPQALAPRLDWPVLVFCISATLLAALLSGLAPALRAAHTDAQKGLKESAKGSASGATNRLRQLLVSAEIALSVMLLTGAGLLIHSFVRLLDVHPGFEAENTVTARISLPLTTYSHEAGTAFWQKFLAAVQAMPGIESAAIITDLPMTAGNSSSYINAVGSSETVYSDELGISQDLFRTLRIPMLAGRGFDGTEGEKNPPLAIVSRSFAEKVFPGQNPIGKKFHGGPVDGDSTIIGVVGDVHMHGLSEAAPLEMYYIYPQYGVDSAGVIVRSHQQTSVIRSELAKVLRSLDPSLPLGDVKPLADYSERLLGGRKFMLGLLSAFAGLAILLAGIGLYGVLAFSVEQRTREIGIRVALGAARGEVVRLILNECSWMALIGLAAGLLGAWFAGGFMKSLLFGVTGTDWTSYFAAIILVLGIAAFVSLAPAWRATRVDPVNALRYE